LRLWILSDTHFGKHAVDSEKWLLMMKSYFYDFFIPTLKSKIKPEDKLIFLGDLFDNRNSINLKIINEVIQLFEKLSQIIECHVLLGNHDMYLMNSSDINSPAVIKHIPNIHIYDKPKIIDLDGLKTLMMPWISGKDNEKAILEKYKGCDLLFCHSDLNGCRTQLYPTRPIHKNILDIANDTIITDWKDVIVNIIIFQDRTFNKNMLAKVQKKYEIFFKKQDKISRQ
jgi:calcineurin-like phosphoesterase family protein